MMDMLELGFITLMALLLFFAIYVAAQAIFSDRVGFVARKAQPSVQRNKDCGMRENTERPEQRHFRRLLIDVLLLCAVSIGVAGLLAFIVPSRSVGTEAAWIIFVGSTIVTLSLLYSVQSRIKCIQGLHELSLEESVLNNACIKFRKVTSQRRGGGYGKTCPSRYDDQIGLIGK